MGLMSREKKKTMLCGILVWYSVFCPEDFEWQMQYKCRDGVDYPAGGSGRDWQYLKRGGGGGE